MKPIASAIYRDGYGERAANLVARKTSRGITHRWIDTNGQACDGLRLGVYSVAYQLRHAERHACFANVTRADQ